MSDEPECPRCNDDATVPCDCIAGCIAERCENMTLQRIPGSVPWAMECIRCGRRWPAGEHPGPGMTHSTSEVTRRTVRQGNHLVTQVRQSDGTWWNMRIEPVRDR